MQIAKMDKCAENDGKQHRVYQRIYEAVVKFDKASRRVEHEHNCRGDQNWLERTHGNPPLMLVTFPGDETAFALPTRPYGCFSFLAARTPSARASCSHI